MDVVLELADTFLFDRLWANLLPINPAVANFDPISTITAGFKGFDYNATYNAASSAALAGDASLARSAWSFQPSSEWFSVQPSEFAWMSRWDRDNVWRQMLTLYVITWFFGAAIYFLCATLSYLFVFDKTTFNHPKYLKNQIRMEIAQTQRSIPIMAVLTVPFFLLEVRGHGYMYDDALAPGFTHPMLSLFGSWYNWIQFPLFIMFTDCGIYWIHRGLHSKMLYKRLHKPHHKWIMPTPFASHAFHPLDGYAQSVPYHLFPFLFPLQKFAYIALFTFIQIWTVMIHDGEYVANSPVINGAACHTMHHLYFNYNYGQFTTLWDRLGGSYRQPNPELFEKEKKMSEVEWSRQSQEMEKMVVEVEGRDERTYGTEEPLLGSKKVQ
ncbi:c-5 sterol desaturase [Recurvomyces mirabilis]|uniref:C-5 sterol desaturase n=1 Tax=Recurvomyces mirabilis TaxID=574656 RepID=A0AAE0WRS2_9PEZI|nr:c-5 sterol desaturase [Recurvomyces mirabilis]KAK5154832.1 c-5 sterol desaturase [Recurvomyces mirabilis]